MSAGNGDRNESREWMSEAKMANKQARLGLEGSRDVILRLAWLEQW